MNKKKPENSSETLRLIQREPSTHAKRLSSAIFGDLLSRSIHELIATEKIASALVNGIRGCAESADLQSWIEKRVTSSLDWLEDEFEGPIENHLADETIQALRRISNHPYRVDPLLVSSVLRHKHVRKMMQSGLQNLLTDFGNTLLSSLPVSGRSGAFAGLMDVAKTMASRVSAEIDRQLEGRVKDFVEETIEKGINQWTKNLSIIENAEKFAETREVFLDILLEEPVKHYIAIPRRADVELISNALLDEIRALASWEGFGDELRSTIQAAMKPMENQSLQEFLEGSDLIESWRAPLEELLAEHISGFFQTAFFEDWLLNLERPEIAHSDEGSPATLRAKVKKPV